MLRPLFIHAAAAGALALSLAGGVSANTLLADGSSGNGSLFLNVSNETTNWSFAFDTGLRLGDILAAPGTGRSFSLGADPNWQTFLTKITNASGPDVVIYNVVALNAVAPTNYAALVTSAAPTGTEAGSVGTTSNSNLKQFNAVNPFINAVNQVTSSTLNSAVVSGASDDAAYFGTSFQSNWFGKAGFDTTAPIGSALSFYALALNGTSNLAKAAVTVLPGTWNLTSGGELTYSTAVVPLPGSVGLLATAVSAFGAYLRLRKSTKRGA